MRSHYLRDLDAFVRYLELPGDDPPHVWLHGLGRSSTTLAHVAAHARLRKRRSLLVDLLGFGISDKPDTFSYSLDDHAAVVVRLLDGVGAATGVLIGHSLGGTVAVLAAARRPELVSALVVAEGNLDPGGAPMSLEIVAQSEDEYVAEGFRRGLERMHAQARANPTSVVAARLGSQQLAAPVAMYRTARSLVEMTRPTVREQLLDLDVPRLFVVAAHTLEAPRKPPSGEAGEGLERTGVRVTVVPDTGHSLMFENPDGFAHAIADFLDEA